MQSLDSLAHLPEVPSPQYVVFTDFDETYLAHHGKEAELRDREELEHFLEVLATQHHVLFGWVTGSTIDGVTTKAHSYGLRVVPHFIASSIGSELDLFNRKHGRHVDPEWDARIARSGFSKDLVNALLAALAERGVALKKQKQTGIRIESYYYFRRGDALDKHAIATIREQCAAYSVGVNVSQCNPLVGDPADAYDVDFVPIVCGKRNTVEFILERYGIPKSRAFAFGDNVGDIEMLEAVEHGYLVSNATEAARSRFHRLVDAPYARGILSVLQQHIKG